MCKAPCSRKNSGWLLATGAVGWFATGNAGKGGNLPQRALPKNPAIVRVATLPEVPISYLFALVSKGLLPLSIPAAVHWAGGLSVLSLYFYH
jgi:hypothetical protein